jgi:hypothetical protein
VEKGNVKKWIFSAAEGTVAAHAEIAVEAPASFARAG